MTEGRHRQARHRQPRPKLIGPGLVKVAIPGAAVALVATGSAAALPGQHDVKVDTPIASSSLQLARDVSTSRATTPSWIRNPSSSMPEVNQP